MGSLQLQKERVAMLSVASNSLLVLLKVIVGTAIGSVAIISEAIHSAMDWLAAVVALFSVKRSHLPADIGHPFGHGKLESVSGLVEAVLIFIAAFWIIFEAVKKLVSAQPIEYPGWGTAVMFFSAVVNYFVSRRLFQVGRAADSVALEADAWHLRTDVYTSLGVMFSFLIIWMSKYFWKDINFYWLDPTAAIFIAVFILKAAYDLTAKALSGLMDVKLPVNEEDMIRGIIAGRQPAVRGFHRLKTRKAGNFRFIEFHIKVNPQMSVTSSHEITRTLKNLIIGKLPNTTVNIHVEPCEGDCTEECAAGCFLDKEQRPVALRHSA
ncbi:MAG: cation diffusion facilitator family transporter [Smithellaceae bacterium]|nr:cation transporter [Syntrophaceae bacterium]MBP8608456.1 cation transporter [Syntrophaceae bacterium]NMD04403.1 cation transporter [Deltaproteobacteria bacterium]